MSSRKNPADAGEVAVAERRSSLELAKPSVAVPLTFADAMSAWDTAGGVVEMPTDWRLVEKETLLGVPFLIHRFRFHDGGANDEGEFVSVEVVTEDDRRLVFNDGGTGIYRQLVDWAAQSGRSGGLLVRGGLRVSEYEYFDDKGKGHQAKTFYLNP